MWTPTTRKQHIRKTSRYQTDVTDQEWEVIACHLPVVSAMGRPRAWPMRDPRSRRWRTARLFSESSPTADMLMRGSPRPPRSPSKLCAKIPVKSASPSSRAAGSSNGSSPGLGAIGDWLKTSKPPSTLRALSSTPLLSCSSCVGSRVLHDFRNRLLQ
jgi:hypothetical protein